MLFNERIAKISLSNMEPGLATVDFCRPSKSGFSGTVVSDNEVSIRGLVRGGDFAFHVVDAVEAGDL